MRWLADAPRRRSPAAASATTTSSPATRRRLVDAGVLCVGQRGLRARRRRRVTLEQRCSRARLLRIRAGSSPVRPPAYSPDSAGCRADQHSTSPCITASLVATTRACASVRPRSSGRSIAVRAPDGIVVASWPRLAFDLAADLRAARSPVRRAAAAPREAGDHRRARRHRPPTRTPDSTGLRCVPAHARVADGSARRTSHIRRSFSQMRSAAATSRSSTRHELSDASNGRTARVDLAVSRRASGASNSTSILSTGRTTACTDDARRRRDFHSIGWQVETVTELDMEDVEAFADELVGLYHARRDPVECVVSGLPPRTLMARTLGWTERVRWWGLRCGGRRRRRGRA